MDFAEQRKLGNTCLGKSIWGYLCFVKMFSWGTLGSDCTVFKWKDYHLVAILLIGSIFP